MFRGKKNKNATVVETSNTRPLYKNPSLDFNSLENPPIKQRRGLCLGFDCCGCRWWI